MTISIPPNFETLALSKFDFLLKNNEILYEPPKISITTLSRIPFHFSTTPVLGTKPVLAPDDPGRTKAVGPFVDPPEDFIVTRIGETHTVIVNKYCVYRPQLILHTTLFVPQTSDLDISDITAAWALLHAFDTPQMVIYNCGVESGSSQGHKHLQIFPRQDDEKFSMWPNRVEEIDEVAKSIPGIPFVQFITGLPNSASAQHVFSQYQHLLKETKTALRNAGAGTDYNLILVPEWLLLIPRRNKGEGPFIMNAANMVGLMWMKNEDLKEQLIEMGVSALAELGIPLDK